MRPAIVTIFLFLLTGAADAASPTVTVIEDSASFSPRVSPGSLATIFGANLASSEAQATSTPLPTSLGGTTLTINGTAVPLSYVSGGQINFQVPAKTAAGQGTLVVKAASGTSQSYTFTVAAQAPGLFQDSSGHAIAQNSDSAHSINSSSSPAAVGSVITVYLTGIGPVDNAVADGTPAPSSPLSKATQSATATIGLKSASVQFLGLSPGFIGLGQANVQIPSLPTGDYPLVITIGGTVSTSATVSVSGTGTYTAPLTLAGSAAFGNSVSSTVALLNNTAYVCNASQIVILDVTDATKPSVLGNFGSSDLNGNGTICVINTSYGNPYLVDVVGPLSSPVYFAVYDLSNPRSPSRLGVVQTQYSYLVSLSFSGGYGFATTSYFSFNRSNNAITAQHGDFLVFNFTSPGQPSLLAALQPTGSAAANNLALKPASAVINQITAYEATSTATGASTSGTGALDIVNIGSPTAPVAINQVTAPNTAILQSFDVSGNILLAAGNTAGNRNPGSPDFSFTGNLTLTTMDVTNTQNPVVLSSFDTGIQVDGSFKTAAFPNAIFAVASNPPASDIGGPASLMIVDARQPSTPVYYSYQSQFGFSGMLATSSGFLLAPTIHGLNIYKLQLQ